MANEICRQEEDFEHDQRYESRRIIEHHQEARKQIGNEEVGHRYGIIIVPNPNASQLCVRTSLSCPSDVSCKQNAIYLRDVDAYVGHHPDREYDHKWRELVHNKVSINRVEDDLKRGARARAPFRT